MPYPDLLLEPVRRELTRHGVRELRTPAEVEEALGAPGTAAVAVNSLCGCSSARMRPAFVRAIHGAACRPDRLLTVFAGQDLEATARARGYFEGYPPSSPSVFLLHDGRVVWALQRRDIEGRRPEDVASDIRMAFERFCSDAGAAAIPADAADIPGDVAG